ncbi:unnamed protein product [Lymnaea stagnalis]|uniref:G-protein coupled receptors family 2 profile 2 domain-containing protein n=1 Tax=Lymnaea stagnalis TaxID=6523 RepID=A0AAV2IMH9_LYMST
MGLGATPRAFRTNGQTTPNVTTTRQLRQQHRIRLHICLMLSSFMTSVSMLAWDLFIFQDRLATAEKDNAVINKNGVGCRILQLLTRYTQLAAFMWMFIEGFHLHRLLVHAFSVPKTLVPYYVFGFGMPIIPIIVYAAIRGTDDELNKL